MRVGIATDHGGFGLKEELVLRLRAAGHEIEDFGAYALNPADDYPDFVVPLAEAVVSGQVTRGVAICGSGVGASVCANKVAGVRAALCGDAATAAGARKWNDANVLALSLRATSQAELEEILDAWFAAAPSTDEDDAANIAHLGDIESRGR